MQHHLVLDTYLCNSSVSSVYLFIYTEEFKLLMGIDLQCTCFWEAHID